MKYLDEMTKEELINCAKKEKIFMGLSFNKEKIMKKLEKKGYKYSQAFGENIEKNHETEEKKNIIVEKIEEFAEKAAEKFEEIKEEFIDRKSQNEETAIREVEEIDFSVEGIFNYRTRT